MKKVPPLLLSVLSGFLLFAAWPVSIFTFLIFVAWVPLIVLAGNCPKGLWYFGWTYLTLLIWNAATTWWTCNSTLPGGVAAILANALLMSLPWIGFYYLARRKGELLGYASLVVFWLCFEWVHLNWELSWPWLTLGNAFSIHPRWIQWYEYTGVAGGTIWILLTNIFAALLWNRYSKRRQWSTKVIVSLAAALLFPLIISFFILHSRMQEIEHRPSGENTANVVIVQPDVDPWDEKFVAGKQEEQLQKLIHLSLAQMDSSTRLVVWPETAIPVAINEDSMKTSYFLRPVWDFLKAHPAINLVTGVEGFRFQTQATKTKYSEKIPGSNLYVDGYNSAVLMDSSDFEVYHKSKLVPGAEVLPSFLSFLKPIFENFGGTTGGYARQKERTVLLAYNRSYAVAPAVCYESVYGEFMSEYVRRGANLIVIITNDGWWGNTAGYRQHESYARLRAIETRRWVVRSANTGISCFIDPLGHVIDPQPWDKATSIKLSVPASSDLTFYVRHGDFLYMISVAVSLILIGWCLFILIKKMAGRGKAN